MSNATYQVLDLRSESQVDTKFELDHAEVVDQPNGPVLAMYSYQVDGVIRSIYFDSAAIDKILHALNYDDSRKVTK